MSWNGTVRCGHCYETGHNKRSCPAYTEQLKVRAQSEVDRGEGQEGYWHRAYAKRTGLWVDGTSAKELKKTRRDAGRQRRCKYCGKTGHNTRTCPELKEAKATYITEARNYRTAALAALQQRGLGVGALVVTERYNEKLAWMVKAIRWEQMTHQTGQRNTGLIELEILNPALVSSWQRRNTVPVPPIGEIGTHDAYTVVGPVAAEAVGIGVPENWLEEECGVDEAFKEARSPNYHDNYYGY